NRGLAYCGVPEKSRFHFTGFNTHAANLNLLVQAAENLQFAIELISATIATTVEKIAMSSSVWIDKETLLVCSRAVDIAESKIWTPENDLSRLPKPTKLVGTIEHQR